MLKLKLTPRAAAELDEIWYRCARDRGLDFADNFVGRISRTLKRTVCQFPGLGVDRSEFGESLRSYTVEGYYVFFKVTEYIEVHHIRHGRRSMHPGSISFLPAEALHTLMLEAA